MYMIAALSRVVIIEDEAVPRMALVSDAKATFPQAEVLQASSLDEASAVVQGLVGGVQGKTVVLLDGCLGRGAAYNTAPILDALAPLGESAIVVAMSSINDIRVQMLRRAQELGITALEAPDKSRAITVLKKQLTTSGE